jgi:long-chain acyl-CoA synthetase
LRVLADVFDHHRGPFLDQASAPAQTYEETAVEAARIGAFLRARGVQRGDTVAIAMSNTAAAATVWFGLLRDGVAAVPLNPSLPDEEIAYILRMAEAKLIFSDAAVMPKAERWVEEIGSRIEAVAAADRPWKNYSEAPRQYVDPEDIAVIFFTSGTTGRPKGAMLSHRSLLENARGSAISYALNGTAAFACPIPIFHAFAATVCLFLPALLGGRTYLHSPLDMKGFISTLGQLEGKRILVAVPSILEGMSLMAPALPGGLIPNTLFVVSGGAALPGHVRDKIAAAAAAAVYEGYGTTECGPVISAQTPDGLHSDGSVGKAIAGVEVEIRSSEGNAVRQGEIGEIVVRTPGLMSGYYDLAAATRSTMKGGWFYTGDLGYLSADNELFIVDRLTDAITVKGITVLPQTVEAVLNRHPAVAEAAVVGIPDGSGGETPWAFIRPRGGDTAPGMPPTLPTSLPDPSDLIRHCREQLPIYAVPRGIEFRDSLPKTITGKILKRTLRQKWL